MRYLLVTGARKYTRLMVVREALSTWVGEHDPEACLILHGGGRTGPAAQAEEWAKDRGIHCAKVTARWAALGRGARPRRDSLLATLGATLGATVYGFWDGREGSLDTVRQCQRLRLSVRVWGPDGAPWLVASNVSVR